MAYIQKRQRNKGTTYTATVRIKGYKTETATFQRKTDAVAWANRVEVDMRERKFKSPSQIDKTLREMLETYLFKISKYKAPKTYKNDVAVARIILKYCGDKIRINEITPKFVADYKRERLKSVSAYAVRLEFALLSHMFNVAIKEWGYPLENPVLKVKKPPAPEGRTVFLTEAEAQKLLQKCKESQNKMLYTYVLLMIRTGMRPGECAGLKWENINFDKKIIELKKTKTKPRIVPMTESIIEELSKYKKEKGFIFLPGTKERLNPSEFFRRSWMTARKRAGLENVHLHDLRHTAASHLIMAGVDLRTVAEILGHTTLNMVMRYTHLLHQHKLDAINKIDSLGGKK